MKRYLTLLVLTFSLSLSAEDYRQEIMDHMVNPCFEMKMRRMGIDIQKNHAEMERFVRMHSAEIEDIIETAQFAISILPDPSFNQRMELYRIGLDSCLAS